MISQGISDDIAHITEQSSEFTADRHLKELGGRTNLVDLENDKTNPSRTAGNRAIS